MQHLLTHDIQRIPWNKGKITGQKPPLKRNEIWSIRVHLQIRGKIRDLALFNLAIDSKLRACDLVRIRVRDVTQSNQIASRAMSGGPPATAKLAAAKVATEIINVTLFIIQTLLFFVIV